MKASLIAQLKPARVCVDHLLQRSRQPTREKARTAKFLTKSRGGFPPTSGNLKIPYEEEAGGDPVKGRGQNIPLVTDTGSGL